MKLKTLRQYNVQIWVGLRNQYSNHVHPIDDARRVCQNYVNEIGDCVTITPTDYIYTSGSEPGVVIGYIQYPRFPRTRKEIRKRAIELAKRLMIELNQLRVTVTTPYKSYMLSK